MNTSTRKLTVGYAGGHGTKTFRDMHTLRAQDRFNSDLALLQNASDSGGHSGILRRELDILPPGDKREGILALSDKNLHPCYRTLLTFRSWPKGAFKRDVSLRNLILIALKKTYGEQIGADLASNLFDKTASDSNVFSRGLHQIFQTILAFKDWPKSIFEKNASLGNLILASLSIIYGEIRGTEYACKLFGVQDKVWPISLSKADLCAELSDGTLVCGEGMIDTRSPFDERKIVKIFLRPSIDPKAGPLKASFNRNLKLFPGAHDLILKSDLNAVLQGDLFSSITAIMLIPGMPQACQSSRGKWVFTTNIMTKGAETPGYTASQFAQTFLEYAGLDHFDVIICNNGVIRPDIQRHYAKENAFPVKVDRPALRKISKRVIIEDVVDQSSGHPVHSMRLAEIIASLL